MGSDKKLYSYIMNRIIVTTFIEHITRPNTNTGK
jgi:hypothetical protein